MELNYCSFLQIDSRPSAINRQTYTDVFETYDRHMLSGSLPFSVLEFIVCLTKRCVPDVKVTEEQLAGILHRVPVAVLCGGFAAGAGVKKGDKLSTRYLPAPITPAHFDRLSQTLLKLASYNDVVLEGLGKLKAQHDLFVTAALKSKFVNIVEPMSLMGLAAEETDSTKPVIMGSHNNEWLLAETLAGWLKIPLFVPIEVEMSKSSIEVVQYDGSYVYPNIINTADSLSNDVVMPDRLPRSGSHAPAESKAMLEQNIHSRHIQTKAECFGVNIPMTVTMVKLYSILEIISVYYKMSIRHWSREARVLDLCSDPGNMSLLMASLGAVVDSQTVTNNPVWKGHSRVSRASCVLPRLDLTDFGRNLTENASNNSYSLVICDGHTEEDEDETDNKLLFWAQLYIAIRLIGFGGTVIVKTTQSIVDLWDSLADLRVKNEERDCCAKAWSQFNHWSVVKPIGSRFYGSEVYWCFFGYRHNVKKIEGVNTLSHLVIAQNRIFARAVRRYSIDKELKEKVPIKVPDLKVFFAESFDPEPVSPALFKSVDYRQVITKNLTPLRPLYPKALDSVIDLWNEKFEIEAILHYAGMLLPIKVPPEINSIHVKTLESSVLDVMSYYMNWLARPPPDRLNHKAFVLEFLQRMSMLAGYDTTYVSTGEHHKPLWSCVIRVTVKISDVDWLFHLLDGFVARSTSHLTKKDAEQDAFRLIIEHMTNCNIYWLVTKDESSAVKFDYDLLQLFEKIKKARMMSYQEIGKCVIGTSLERMPRSELIGLLKSDKSLEGFIDDSVYFNGRSAGLVPKFINSNVDKSMAWADMKLTVKYCAQHAPGMIAIMSFVRSVTLRDVEGETLREVFRTRGKDGKFGPDAYELYDETLSKLISPYIKKRN